MRNLSIAAFTCAAFLQSAPVDKPVVWSAADIRWTDNPAMKGAQQAILWGDPTKGAYGALKRIPAGTVVAMHAHTNETRVVSVAGTMSFSLEGGPATDLGPQSYASIPGGVKHSATCKVASDCVYFETSTGAYDIKTP